MSQFDFPRINFHGSVLLDVPTGNNGKFSPLKIYNQDAALPYTPPRVYIISSLVSTVQSKGFTVKLDSDSPYENYNQYVDIDTISNENYEKWAIHHLGKSGLDDKFIPLYEIIPLDGEGPQPMLIDAMVQPSYWNYFGDLSVYVEDIRITGIQVPDGHGNVSTYTPGNSSGCPAGLAQLLGESFSFHTDFFNPNSKTSAMFCDVDSIGDTCTQMFYSKAGIYDSTSGQKKTFFTGVPCKSAFTWLSLCKTLNYNNGLLMPMSGGTYFESTITLDSNKVDSALQQDWNQYAGENVDKLSMKILLHRVYEVRNPDYSKMPTKPIGNNRTSVKKNPARVAFSGSLCPFKEGVDMTTHNVGRILKNGIKNNPTINYSNIDAPQPLGYNVPLTFPKTVQLPPAFVHVNPTDKVISLDIINTICEYGKGFGPYSDYGGITSIPPFLSWENYDFGLLYLFFVPDDGSPGIKIGQIDHTNDYNVETFLARGGVMDFPIPSGVSDFSKGRFGLYTSSYSELLIEDDYLLLSDQQGSYAEQGQAASEGYKSDGPDRGPVLIRCFYRGKPLQGSVDGKVRNGNTNELSDFTFYDGVPFEFGALEPGCTQYVLGVTPEQYNEPGSPAEGLYFAANGYSVINRVLAKKAYLEKYLDKSEPLTWDVLYDEILSNYHSVLPIMNAILPFDSGSWSDPSTMGFMLNLVTPEAWGNYMYMPVTRELSKNQQALLVLWAKQKMGVTQ
ncbi:hypothetical protein ACFOSV_06410 [Algoriphagus namhaensis]|uniref:Uncharacterized protein n=1 Tax=Algoriphagus namhaensis TaxID=915353 RepID=A0ABV8APZ6_9BACT